MICTALRKSCGDFWLNKNIRKKKLWVPVTVEHARLYRFETSSRAARTAKIGNLISMAPKHAPSKAASLPSWEIVVSDALKSGATTLPDIKKAVQAQHKQLPSGWEKVLLVQLKKVGQSTASRTTTCCGYSRWWSYTIVE